MHESSYHHSRLRCGPSLVVSTTDFLGRSLQLSDFNFKMMQLCIYRRKYPLLLLPPLLLSLVEILGLLLLIRVSFASSNITRPVNTDLSMPIGQLYLDTFGKKGVEYLYRSSGGFYLLNSDINTY